jgi:hypothetical protein
MATLAVATQVPDSNDRSATKIIRYLLYTGPASYTTGGDIVTADQVGLTAIDFVNVIGNPYNKAGTQMYIASWDYSINSIPWYVPNTGVEVAATTNLTAFSCLVEVVGH